MDWVKLSARYYLDPAVANLDDAAEVMFTRALAYAGDQETGGFIPAGILPALCRSPKYEARARALVDAGLWIPDQARGYRISRWQDWQAELDALAHRRSADRERKRRERERAAGATSGGHGGDRGRKAPAQSGDVSRDTHKGLSRDIVNTCNDLGDPPESQVKGMSRDMSADLSRPHIEKREEEQHPPHPSGASPPRKRGTRIPSDFTVTPEMVAWARTECPHVDGRTETAKFIDYWRAATGRTATKLDWVATWRNWMRRAAEHPPARGRHHRQAETDQLFDRAMERARARDAQEANGDPRRDGHPDQIRPRMLPAAGD